MPPTRPVDVNRAAMNINSHRIDTHRVATQVDPQKVDKALSQMIDPAQLGVAYQSYFKLAGEWIGAMSTRIHESETKALTAQAEDPAKYRAEWFDQRDTSKGIAGKDYIQEAIITDPDRARGYFTREQAEALKNLARPFDPNREEARREAWSVQDPNAGQGERGYQQGGGQQQQQGQQQDETPGHAPQGTRLAVVGGPPAPPRGGSSPSQPQGGRIPNMTRGDEDYLNAMFPPGDPQADWIRGMFPMEELSRNIFATGFNEITKNRDLRNRIIAEMNGLDPSKAKDSARLIALQTQLQGLNMDDQRYLDGMGQARVETNKMWDFHRSILETITKDREKLASNIGVR